MAGAGWICKNEHGRVIMAMATPIGKTTTIVAETWALLLAVRMAALKEWNTIQFETDSTALLTLVSKDPSEAPWIIRTLLQEIQQHLRLIQPYVITHSYREANQAADGLADFTAKNNYNTGLESSTEHQPTYESTLPLISLM
ncbi:uncharacterized protein LOC113272146 [Papaver somniferum]|uniref:uncharacterized protein LOC113272146 n=1 Tax=Papaver somniferum TaxID=3469 RepID=UPI000E6F9E7A|nr:uncharacterized protein LOC113272146 [Papaver somniferum]